MDNYVAITDGACSCYLDLRCSFALYRTNNLYSVETIQNLMHEEPIHAEIQSLILAYRRLLNSLLAEVAAVHSLIAYMHNTGLLSKDVRLTIYTDCTPMVEQFQEITRRNDYHLRSAIEGMKQFFKRIKTKNGFDFKTMSTFVVIPGDIMKTDTILQH